MLQVLGLARLFNEGGAEKKDAMVSFVLSVMNWATKKKEKRRGIHRLSALLNETPSSEEHPIERRHGDKDDDQARVGSKIFKLRKMAIYIEQRDARSLSPT